MNSKFLLAVASITSMSLSLGLTQPAFPDSFTVGAGGHDWAPVINTFDSRTSDQPVHESGTLVDFLGQASAEAQASKGEVGASLNGSWVNNNPFLNGLRMVPVVSAHSFEVMQVDGPGSTITTSMASHFSGTSTHGFTLLSSLGSCVCGTVVRASLGVTGTAFSFQVNVTPNKDPEIVQNSIGIVERDRAPGTISFSSDGDNTEPFDVPVGVPITISRSLEIESINQGGGIAANFSDNFNATFSWATDRPVFNLPPGYTVNGAGIVDNHYSLPVPEPQTLGLIFGALVTCAGTRAKRGTKRRRLFCLSWGLRRLGRRTLGATLLPLRRFGGPCG
jgi:hypothetical protein